MRNNIPYKEKNHRRFFFFETVGVSENSRFIYIGKLPKRYKNTSETVNVNKIDLENSFHMGKLVPNTTFINEK